MRDIELPRDLLDEMHSHGRESYPDECCGYLVARSPEASEGPRKVVAVRRAPNEYDGERRRRFVIPAEELRATEQRVAVDGRMVVGFYHSHPDHPARPSTFDQEHAWPWYSYLVLAVDAGRPGELGGFELDPDPLSFREVGVKVLPSPRW